MKQKYELGEKVLIKCQIKKAELLSNGIVYYCEEVPEIPIKEKDILGKGESSD